MPLLDAAEPAVLQRAAQHLASGALLAFPTETVYGLGARADDDAAVARIFAAKGRPAQHPLIVHVGDIEAARHFTTALPAAAQHLVQAFWPGPLTVILPRRPGVADAAAGGQRSIGLRMPSHPVALALLQAAAALGVPGVAGPSANRFGRVSPTTAQHVQQEFGPELWVLDGGPCSVGIESAIVDCTREQPALLRPGQLGRTRIEQVLGQPLAGRDASSPRASGTLEAHYAPRAPVRLFDAAGTTGAAPPWVGTGGGIGVYSRSPVPAAWGTAGLVWRPMPQASAAVAQELFAVLRDLDQHPVVAIWVERPPAGAEWEGVHDRLLRAAAAAPEA
jgi:L-threonylcarbamoyladenylate synthase